MPSRTRRRRAHPGTRILAALAAATLVAACTGDGGDSADVAPPTPPGAAAPGGTEGVPDTERTEVPGGSVFYGAINPPTTLNAAVEEGNTLINAFISAAVLSPLWRVTPDFEYEPLLLAGEPEVETRPFSVTYTLKDDLEWSDGMPLTAEDVAFTQETIMNDRFEIATRRGHDLVRRVKVLDDQRVTFVFSEPYPQWRTMFSQAEGAILPKHMLENKDFDLVWDQEITAASGPFEFDSWDEGQITLRRNENYWGDEPSLDEVAITFHADLTSQVQALQDGEVDVIYAQAQSALREHLETLDDITYEAGPSVLWEHIDFNTVTPPLDKPFVRRAIAMAIDRERIVDTLAQPLDPDAEVLDSVLWLTNQPDYDGAWASAIPHDPDAAEQLLVRNGCRRRGEVYRCRRAPLELDMATTSDPRRSELAELIREDLQDVGIKLNKAPAESEVIFEPEFLRSPHKWDLLVFAHRGGVDPAQAQVTWRCTSPPWINNSKYCNRRVDRLFAAADAATDEDERAALLGRADNLIAQDVPAVPLYQQPSYLIWRSSVVGPQHNPSEWGPLWNVGEWVFTQ